MLTVCCQLTDCHVTTFWLQVKWHLTFACPSTENTKAFQSYQRWKKRQSVLNLRSSWGYRWSTQTSYVTSLEERERDIGLFAVSQWSIIRFWGNRGKMGKGYYFCYCFEGFPVFGIVLVPLRTYQNQHFLQSYQLSTSCTSSFFARSI